MQDPNKLESDEVLNEVMRDMLARKEHAKKEHSAGLAEKRESILQKRINRKDILKKRALIEAALKMLYGNDKSRL